MQVAAADTSVVNGCLSILMRVDSVLADAGVVAATDRPRCREDAVVRGTRAIPGSQLTTSNCLINKLQKTTPSLAEAKTSGGQFGPV